MSDEEVVGTFESALAAELDVHPSNVEVSFDSETGILTYVITSDDIDLVAEAITTVSEPEFISRIDVGEGIVINSIDTSDDIVVTVDVIVDASNVPDANVAADAVTQSIQEQDDTYEILSRGKLLNLETFNVSAFVWARF